MKPIVLASQSPRRKEILSYFKLPFIQVSPSFDEDAVEPFPDPVKFAHYLSGQKALSVKDSYRDSVILSSDTIVYFKGTYFAKPTNREHAFQIIKALSNNTHQVITSVTALMGDKMLQDYGLTNVTFNDLTDKEINSFLDLNLWADKAAGYTPQGAGSLLVKSVEGCYYNVLGLPVNALNRVLTPLGLNLWHAD